MLLDAEDDSNNVLIRINDDSTYSFLNGTNYEINTYCRPEFICRNESY